MVLETDKNGQTKDVYTRGLNLIKSNENGYYVYNGHGDVVSIVDGNGLITKTYDYDAFGVETDKNETDLNPFRYCGEYTDLETGSIYLRARYYNPVTGGFMSEDPIRDGLNWYIYANNNPIRFIDPTGLVSVGLKEYAKTYKDSKASWDSDTGTATVSYNGKTLSVKSNSGNNRNGTIYVDDSQFVSAFGIGSEKLTVYSEGNNVSIRANFKILGAGADNKIGNSLVSYRNAFLQGIKSGWSGTFGEYKVSTYTGEDDNGIRVGISSQAGVSFVSWGVFGWSKTDPGDVTMNTGDSRNGHVYSVMDFMWVSAHEFGHNLGVVDAYSSKNGKNVISIYNEFRTGAQETDIDMILKAWDTGKRQGW